MSIKTTLYQITIKLLPQIIYSCTLALLLASDSQFPKDLPKHVQATLSTPTLEAHKFMANIAR